MPRHHCDMQVFNLRGSVFLAIYAFSNVLITALKHGVSRNQINYNQRIAIVEDIYLKIHTLDTHSNFCEVYRNPLRASNSAIYKFR